jgi:hypothetical protein
LKRRVAARLDGTFVADANREFAAVAVEFRGILVCVLY